MSGTDDNGSVVEEYDEDDTTSVSSSTSPKARKKSSSNKLLGSLHHSFDLMKTRTSSMDKSLSTHNITTLSPIFSSSDSALLSNNNAQPETLARDRSFSISTQFRDLSDADKKFVHEFLKHDTSIIYDEDKLLGFLSSLNNQGKLVPVLNEIVRDEIQNNKMALLREESVGATLLKGYWFHFEGRDYLQKVIKPLIKTVKKETQSKPLEIDPNKIDAHNVDKNVKKLSSIVKKFLKEFFQSYDMFPPNFEYVLNNFYRLLTESESKKSYLGLGYSEDALRLFGGFLMLRFICPAIVSPTKCGIKKEYPLPVLRALVLVSKVLQGVANQVEFEGEKEPYMLPLNSFVRDTMPHMMAFLNTLMNEQRSRRPSKKEKKSKDKDKDKEQKKREVTTSSTSISSIDSTTFSSDSDSGIPVTENGK